MNFCTEIHLRLHTRFNVRLAPDAAYSHENTLFLWEFGNLNAHAINGCTVIFVTVSSIIHLKIQRFHGIDGHYHDCNEGKSWTELYLGGLGLLSLGNPPSRGGARTGGRCLRELSLVRSVGITLPHLLRASILWDGSILVLFLKV